MTCEQARREGDRRHLEFCPDCIEWKRADDLLRAHGALAFAAPPELADRIAGLTRTRRRARSREIWHLAAAAAATVIALVGTWRYLEPLWDRVQQEVSARLADFGRVPERIELDIRRQWEKLYVPR